MSAKFSNDKFFIFKSIIVIAASIAVSFIGNLYILVGILVALSAIYKVAGLSFKIFLADVRIILFIFILSLIFLIFFKYINIRELIIISLRMAALLSIFSLFIRTTHINNLINFMRKFCGQRIVFALCASLKFLPLLANEMKDIYYVQKNRGVKLRFKNFINGSYFLSLIIPFIIVSLKIIGNLILTAHIKKLDFSKKRSSIYESG
ncbi:MAG TPA: energy-coupling factor transporter transmembrane component T, partial [bacterium]|nr:energy-coupling factor transporter transmembrane component T [bacterium]